MEEYKYNYGVHGRCCANCKHCEGDGFNIICKKQGFPPLPTAVCDRYEVRSDIAALTPGTQWRVSYGIVSKDYRWHSYYVILNARNKYEACAMVRYEVAKRTNRSPRGLVADKYDPSNNRGNSVYRSETEGYPAFGDFPKK